jgi:predicted transcriptional regulator
LEVAGVSNQIAWDFQRKIRRCNMKAIKVKDIMVPLAECPTLSEEATLHEAALALEEAQQGSKQRGAVMVVNKNQDVVGRIGQLDVIRGFEPGYEKMGELRGISRSGLTAGFIKSMIDKYSLWEGALGDICRKAANAKVRDIMYTSSEHEYVEEDATLDQAVHQLVTGHHQSLFVIRADKVIGILRLEDVFTEICKAVRACQL